MTRKKRRREKDSGRPSDARPRPVSTRDSFGRHSTAISLAVIVAVALAFFHRVVFMGEILTGGDVLAGAAIFEHYATGRMALGHLPLWNPYIFCGMPLFESMSWSAFVYPSYWIDFAIERIPGVDLPRLFFLFLHYVLAGVGMFFYLRSRKVGHGGALAGGLLFMLTPHLVGLATIGHGGKVLASAYIPLVLMAAHRLLETRGGRWVAILGLVGGLQFLARHVQVSYYTWLAVAVLAILWLVESRRDRIGARLLAGRTAALVAGAVLAAALAAMLLLPLREYAAYSTRAAEDGGMGFDQAVMWSLHPKELLTFLVPAAFGLADRTYWGPMPFQQVTHYVGYVALCFAAIALVRKRDRNTAFLGLLLALSVFLAFGRYIGPVYRLLYSVLPGFSRFRVPAMSLLIAQFAAAALAGHGVGVLLEERRTHGRALLRWAVGTAAVGAAVGLIVMGARAGIGRAAAAALMEKYAGADPGILRDVGREAARLAFRDAGILIAFAAATGVAVFVAGTRKLAAWITAALLIGVAVWDIAVVDARFMHPEKMKPLSSYYPESPTVTFLKAQPGVFRVAPLGQAFSSNAWMYHEIQSIGGYHPAKLTVVDDLLNDVGITNLNVLAMMNVRYVVGPDDLGHPAFRHVGPGVNEYLGALPRAFLVGEARSAPNERLMLAEYGVDSFAPSQYATVLGELPGPVESAEGSTVEITRYEPESIEMRADIRRPCLLVVSEVYYPPGWKAFVDGSETPIYRTNYAFRSVYLEPGTHIVAMRHTSPSLRTGLLVSLIAAVILVLLWAAPRRAAPEGAIS
jgi:hypothetical protein